MQSPTVGDALWSPAVDRNSGAAGIFVPSEHGVSDTGILAEGVLDAAQWVTARSISNGCAACATTGEMRNFADWSVQPGAANARPPTSRSLRWNRVTSAAEAPPMRSNRCSESRRASSTRGHPAFHRERLTAFELALRDADFRTAEPRDHLLDQAVYCIELERKRALPRCCRVRSPLPSCAHRMNQAGRLVHSSIGLARPSELSMYGYISEYDGYGMTSDNRAATTPRIWRPRCLGHSPSGSSST